MLYINNIVIRVIVTHLVFGVARDKKTNCTHVHAYKSLFGQCSYLNIDTLHLSTISLNYISNKTLFHSMME